jgi:hypothetical protein
MPPEETEKKNDGAALPIDKIPEKDPAQLEPFDPVRELLFVERERIGSMNRRTEIAREAIQMSDTADKRQFDYRMEKLRLEDQSDQRRHALSSRILWSGGVTSLFLLLSLLGMAFFASPEKAALAIDLLKVIFTGLGGGGILTLILQTVRWLTRER